VSGIVSYVRVSTQRQGASGLGLEAQRAAVDAYCKQHGVKVGREFQEIESGRNDERAVLREAIAYAKRTRSKLVIGKLDRLARSVSFISNVMESGVDFAACDVPEANRLLLHIMAAVAENEARAISDRTVQALAAAKARGTPLGATNPKSRNMTPAVMEQGRALGAKAA
jgi:DNA invertase Pin-like site-specific DNA recombinase